MILNYWPEFDDKMPVFPDAAAVVCDEASSRALQSSVLNAINASKTSAPLKSFQEFGLPLVLEVKASKAYLTSRRNEATPTQTPDSYAGPSPEVVPLVDNAWSPPSTDSRVCDQRPVSGPPWVDARLYSPALGSNGGVLDWVKANPLKAALLALIGGAGIYALGQR